MASFTLAIIEDIDDIRTGLSGYLEKQKELSSVHAFDSMETFFDAVSKGFVPEMVLSDIGLKGMDGIRGIEKIHSQFPETDIIMLTVFRDNDKIFNSLCAGATGYVLKGTPMNEIKKAILEIRNGGSYMSPSIARLVVEAFTQRAPRKAEAQLTDREIEVVNGLTEGMSYKMIAEKLSVSVDTVRFRIKSIYRKLHVNSKSEVVAKALRGEI